MLLAIIRALRRVLSAVGSAASRALWALFGGDGNPQRPSPAFEEEVVNEQVEELRDDLKAARERPTVEVETLGARIHAYAAGDRDIRETFDFTAIPEHVSVALLTMPPDQLCRLALAGPAICERWAAGEARTGLVGVPLPGTDSPSAAVKPQATDEDEKTPLPALVPAGERPSAGRPALAA